MAEQLTREQVEEFIVRHYTDEPHPCIKGNGFDGLTLGDYREEAEAFVKWINERLAMRTIEQRGAAALKPSDQRRGVDGAARQEGFSPDGSREVATTQPAPLQNSGWLPIRDAPMFVYGRDALVGEWTGVWWKKVTLWEREWTREDLSYRGATHWWPHLRDLQPPEQNSAAQESPTGDWCKGSTPATALEGSFNSTVPDERGVDPTPTSASAEPESEQQATLNSRVHEWDEVQRNRVQSIADEPWDIKCARKALAATPH